MRLKYGTFLEISRAAELEEPFSEVIQSMTQYIAIMLIFLHRHLV